MSSSGKQPAFTSNVNHKRILVAASAAATALTFVLTLGAAQLPLFDSSPRVLLPLPTDGRFSLRHALASAVLRWDAFHFAPVAKEGYIYENQWAFFPGAPFVMRTVGSFIRAVSPSEGLQSDLGWEDVLLGGLGASVLSVLSVLKLYDLSLLHLGSANAAFLAALLSLLPSSPVTLRLAGYSEPFFTYFSYTGMLCCARSQWLLAACSFALACAFRSNGIFLSGFIVWSMLVDPVLRRGKISLLKMPYAFVLAALTLSPFVSHQYSAYRTFCTDMDTDRSERTPWCSAALPSIYTYVQAKYWNVGFIRYWTASQAPNFVLAAPPLVLLFTYTSHYLRAALLPRLRDFLLGFSSSSSIGRSESQGPERKVAGSRTDDAPRPSSGRLFLDPSIAPHAIHALLMSLLLLFASHTQIVLRQAASMPVVYWAAAWLLVERPALGRWWVGWSVVWGAVSCVLWAAFLPPA